MEANQAGSRDPPTYLRALSTAEEQEEQCIPSMSTCDKGITGRVWVPGKNAY
jgi:hypothetical protein